jgi:hypothetical protein
LWFLLDVFSVWAFGPWVGVPVLFVAFLIEAEQERTAQARYEALIDDGEEEDE